MATPTRARNQLSEAASPYLRSAAHQPVHWQEWGEDAFARARAENKPILLDIGAVWCHWCHVMDRESYESADLAAIINQHYVPVKVDRDERPDVDARYQTAVGAVSGQGGWPLTAFLTPDGKPFFGGTYFPPEDVMGRPGFRRVLLAAAEAFQNRREDLAESARALETAVARAEALDGESGPFDASAANAVIESATRLFDAAHGGFGHAPKFPHPGAIDLLLERHQSTSDGNLLRIAARSLEGMALGGIQDHIGGGFHRYSVDEQWRVPHFEKMAYDNSELLKSYLHGWQVTGNPLFRGVAEGIVGWVDDVLSDRERGGFYASQDADQTLEDDGDYFTWTQSEIRAALSAEEARAIEIHYDVQPYGEMHHNPEKNVLWVAASAGELSKALGMAESDARILLARAKGKLLEARRKRQPTPAVDTTIYVSWNAMFASAYFEAARALQRPVCAPFARKTLDRLIAEAWQPERGFSHRAGGPALEGTLDDQVFAAAALLDAYEWTLERTYFELAERTVRLAVARFGDPAGGGFYDRARESAPMGGMDVRRKPFQDSPTPGANSAAAIVLDRLYALTGERLYHEWAEKTLEAFGGRIAQYGIFAATYGLAATLHTRHALQVVIAGPEHDARAAALERAANSVYRFGKSVLRITPERSATARLAPALRETLASLDGAKVQAIVCTAATCRPPVADPESLASLLKTA